MIVNSLIGKEGGREGVPSDTMEVRMLVESPFASVADSSWKAVATGWEMPGTEGHLIAMLQRAEIPSSWMMRTALAGSAESLGRCVEKVGGWVGGWVGEWVCKKVGKGVNNRLYERVYPRA